MKYKGKSIEVIGSKMLFGKETLWIHILEDDSFAQILRSDLEEDMPESKHTGMSYVRYIAIAARIGIENIKKAKMRKLQAEKEEWTNTFRKGRSVVPDVNLILTVRIDG